MSCSYPHFALDFVFSRTFSAVTSGNRFCTIARTVSKFAGSAAQSSVTKTLRTGCSLR